VLKVILSLQHGRLAGKSVLTVTAQTRPRTRVTITLTLTRRPGREPKEYTASMLRPLYAVVLHAMSDANSTLLIPAAMVPDDTKPTPNRRPEGGSSRVVCRQLPPCELIQPTRPTATTYR
jgi:hypothetical protein